MSIHAPCPLKYHDRSTDTHLGVRSPSNSTRAANVAVATDLVPQVRCARDRHRHARKLCDLSHRSRTERRSRRAPADIADAICFAIVDFGMIVLSYLAARAVRDERGTRRAWLLIMFASMFSGFGSSASTLEPDSPSEHGDVGLVQRHLRHGLPAHDRRPSLLSDRAAPARRSHHAFVRHRDRRPQRHDDPVVLVRAHGRVRVEHFAGQRRRPSSAIRRPISRCCSPPRSSSCAPRTIEAGRSSASSGSPTCSRRSPTSGTASSTSMSSCTSAPRVIDICWFGGVLFLSVAAIIAAAEEERARYRASRRGAMDGGDSVARGHARVRDALLRDTRESGECRGAARRRARS